MKTLATTLALIALLAAPAFAQKAPQSSANSLYSCGSDPDASIRSELVRDCGRQNAD
jgi:hypothetical protein